MGAAGHVSGMARAAMGPLGSSRVATSRRARTASESTSPCTAYKAWRDRNPGSSFSTPFSATSRTWTGPTATGNAAFDDYKAEQLARLEAERRKLDEEQRAFADYLVKLRKAKDQDEFDRFMAERNAPKPSET